MTQAAAAANVGTATAPSTGTARTQASMSMEERLDHKLRMARKHRGTIRFFENRRWLLSSSEHGDVARPALQRARRDLARVTRTIRAIRKVLARREAARRASMTPREVICEVFGRYCQQAVAVAWCESRLTTTAQNGQYLGLFQMGSHERRTFGHGGSARSQAVAAHRYFVRSGRDWSPWSCKPWYAM